MTKNTTLTDENTRLTKEEYDKLFSSNTTVGEYYNITGRVDGRFRYIMQTICLTLDWYDYPNGSSQDEVNGYFDPKRYGKYEYITFDGVYTLPPPYNTCPDIPIKWLWEDFEDGFFKEVEEYKQEIIKEKERKNLKKKVLQEKKKLHKSKLGEMKKIITSKLTKEELEYIKFV